MTGQQLLLLLPYKEGEHTDKCLSRSTHNQGKILAQQQPLSARQISQIGARHYSTATTTVPKVLSTAGHNMRLSDTVAHFQFNSQEKTVNTTAVELDITRRLLLLLKLL